MYPLSLTLTDFCAYGKSTIDFNDFNCALIVGQRRGDIRRSNGSGKSTIFAGLRFVLFGVGDVNLEKLIRVGTDACKVSFDFISSFDKRTYRIVRSRHRKIGSEVRLYRIENGSEVDLTQRTNSQTEQEINKILKINYTTFCNSAFFGQSDLSGIASLTPSARKKLLKSILQLDNYAKYEKYASRKTNDLLKEIERTKTILSTMGPPEVDIQTFTKELVFNKQNIENQNTSLSLLKEKDTLENSRFLMLKTELNNIENSTVEYSKKYKLLESEVIKLSNSVNEYGRKISNIKDTGSSLLKDVKDTKNDILKLLQIELRSKENIKQDIENILKITIDKKAQINSFNSKLIELKIPLPTGGNCKHCRRIITETEVKSCKEAIDQEIKDYTNSVKSTQEEIAVLQQQDKKLKEELQQVENTSIILNNKNQLLQNKEKEIEIKKSVFVEFNDLLDKSTLEYEIKKQELEQLKLLKPKDNSEQLNKIKSDIMEAKSKISQLIKEINSITINVQSTSNNIAILTHKIEQREKDIEKIKQHKNAINELERKYVVHNKVVSAFGSKGIPALITQTILDDFMLETNSYLMKLYSGLQLEFIIEKERSDGELDDTLDIQFHMNNNVFEFNQLSGAERLIVALSLRLGLGAVLTKRLGVSMQMLLVDEVDQCLDDTNIELFETAIKKLSQEMKVMIITHNNELKTKFNSVICVDQDDNYVSTARLLNG